MPGKKNKKVDISEDKQIIINETIQKFMETGDQVELKFPSTYTKHERAYIHNLVIKLDLKSKSFGKKENRYLTIYKQTVDNIITLQQLSEELISKVKVTFPLSHREREDLLPITQRIQSNKTNRKSKTQPAASTKTLHKSIPQVPRLQINDKLLDFRNSLHISSRKEEIMYAINAHRVVVIAGETGCGKTTQIPQFILEFCQDRNQACKIICTQPRRLSAISVAERVALERNESVGGTFGYQIRLESKVSSRTLLTYCTVGVFLRSLISEVSPLSTITHIIVDEVHERDKLCDFLLIALRDALVKYTSLKLILMSATINTSIFSKYFFDCPVIEIPGRLYDVDIYFLEDILQMTNYMTKSTLKMKNILKNNRNHKYDTIHQNELLAFEYNRTNEEIVNDTKGVNHNTIVKKKADLEPWFIEETDKAIEDAWLYGGEDRFTHILYLIYSENLCVDYQHSINHATALMIAAGRGYLNIVRTLVNLGADLNLKSCNNWTAYDWAKNMKQLECAELIDDCITALNSKEQEDKCSNVSEAPMSDDNKALLDMYHSSFNDENINYELALKLILHIHLKMPVGAILVFLPGFDDIKNLKAKITADSTLRQMKNYNIYILHSNTQTSDQKKVFKQSPQGYRKIILSTNIAETSLTIDDVVYVIDCGKVKEKSFDVISGVCTLQSNWISQACAKQRTGRAGRCQKGICYRMYSSSFYNSMRLHQVPAILRLPLQQLCLYTKHLSSENKSISKFLEKAIEPPSNVIISNAIQLLKTIGALDPWEDLTELGRHLLHLPVEPCLGKMLLYAAILKCLDPILIIVCTLSYRDPFIIPSLPTTKDEVMLARKRFANNSFSDHMAILRAYQIWAKTRTYSQKRIFCDKNFLSFSIMEMVFGIKSQLLAELKNSGFIKPSGPNSINNLNKNSNNWAVVKAALTAGLYPNLIRLDRKRNRLKTQKGGKIRFHSYSVLKNSSKSFNQNSTESNNESDTNSLPCDWMVYEELTRSGRFCLAKNVTLVNSLTIAIFSGSIRLPTDLVYKSVSRSNDNSDSATSQTCKKHATLKLDDWIEFQAEPRMAELILYLRKKWNALFLRCMKEPRRLMSAREELFIEQLIFVMDIEEKASNLQQSLN